MIGPVHYHVVVYGQVQGVGFRRFVEQCARTLDLAGWVTNRPDGDVEVVAAGGADDIAALDAAIRRGPPGAVVRSVEPQTSDVHVPLVRPFSIRRS